MNNNKLTIFLSHSHKDLDKVRKLREILESLDYEPLIFFLKCLDDNNDELEDFIKREIDARNLFIFCKSKNSEQSVWVQRELEYIKDSDIRRLYTIDIDLPLNQTLVSLLHEIGNFIKRNTVFISGRQFKEDNELCDEIKAYLSKYGYKVIRYDRFEGQKEHDEDLKQIIQNGVFMPIITSRYFESAFCTTELNYVLKESIDKKPLILPVIIGCKSVFNIMPELREYNPYIFEYNDYNSDTFFDTLNYNILKRLKDIQ